MQVTKPDTRRRDGLIRHGGRAARTCFRQERSSLRRLTPSTGPWQPAQIAKSEPVASNRARGRTDDFRHCDGLGFGGSPNPASRRDR